MAGTYLNLDKTKDCICPGTGLGLFILYLLSLPHLPLEFSPRPCELIFLCQFPPKINKLTYSLSLLPLTGVVKITTGVM